MWAHASSQQQEPQLFNALPSPLLATVPPPSAFSHKIESYRPAMVLERRAGSPVNGFEAQEDQRKPSSLGAKLSSKKALAQIEALSCILSTSPRPHSCATALQDEHYHGEVFPGPVPEPGLARSAEAGPCRMSIVTGARVSRA